jgi:hypothetical protein
MKDKNHMVISIEAERGFDENWTYFHHKNIEDMRCRKNKTQCNKDNLQLASN